MLQFRPVITARGKEENGIHALILYAMEEMYHAIFAEDRDSSFAQPVMVPGKIRKLQQKSYFRFIAVL